MHLCFLNIIHKLPSSRSISNCFAAGAKWLLLFECETTAWYSAEQYNDWWIVWNWIRFSQFKRLIINQPSFVNLTLWIRESDCEFWCKSCWWFDKCELTIMDHYWKYVINCIVLLAISILILRLDNIVITVHYWSYLIYMFII